MNAQAHNHPANDIDRRLSTFAPEAGPVPRARPRWLLPGLVGVIVAAGLVLANVASLSTVLYVGLIGGMILMHAGHGGHGGHGNHGGPNAPEDLSHGSHGTQPDGSALPDAREDRAAITSSSNETEHHDQHTSRGCH